MPPRDLCKGCRECYSAIMTAIVQHPHIAGLMMGIPVYFLLSLLIFQDTLLIVSKEYAYIHQTASAPYYTLLSFTAIGWCIELVSIRWMLPNILNICAFGHSAIGSWWLVNFGILIFAGWSYIPLRIMPILLVGVLTPSVIWHITGDIIRAYTRKLVQEIELQHTALALQTESTLTHDRIGGTKESV